MGSNNVGGLDKESPMEIDLGQRNELVTIRSERSTSVSQAKSHKPISFNPRMLWVHLRSRSMSTKAKARRRRALYFTDAPRPSPMMALRHHSAQHQCCRVQPCPCSSCSRWLQSRCAVAKRHS